MIYLLLAITLKEWTPTNYFLWPFMETAKKSDKIINTFYFQYTSLRIPTCSLATMSRSGRWTPTRRPIQFCHLTDMSLMSTSREFCPEKNVTAWVGRSDSSSVSTRPHHPNSVMMTPFTSMMTGRYFLHPQMILPMMIHGELEKYFSMAN